LHAYQFRSVWIFHSSKKNNSLPFYPVKTTKHQPDPARRDQEPELAMTLEAS